MPYKDPEKKKARAKAWREDNKERVSTTNKAWAEANKERHAAIKKGWAEANKGRVDATTKAWREDNKERRAATQRGNSLKRKYDLPIEVYEHAIIRQLNLCAICGEPETRKGYTTLVVDHDHATGIVRGFLCHSCNTTLGHMRDNPALLRAAADYLDAHNRHALYSAQIAKRLQVPTT